MKSELFFGVQSNEYSPKKREEENYSNEDRCIPDAHLLLIRRVLTLDPQAKVQRHPRSSQVLEPVGTSYILQAGRARVVVDAGNQAALPKE